MTAYSQPMQWFLTDALEVNQATQGIDAPAAKVIETAPRIHPVVISRWTPDLEAAYTAQVVAESVARMRQRSAELRRKAEGWTGSHYWKVADEMDAAIARLGRSA